MVLDTASLNTGERLTIRMLEPPLGEYASQVGCWPEMREELLSGKLAARLFTPYFVGEINGEVAGSMSYYTPADTRDVGVVEFVQTAERQRRKGVASALLVRLIERFQAEGGLALDLCTTNPHAGALYEKHGFWYLVGDGMRYRAPAAPEFDSAYLAFAGPARIRAATWSDLPRAAILYNHPEPRWLVKEYLTRVFRDMRFESHFVRLMRRIENERGAFLVLENPQRRVVGAAVFERLDSFAEQHVATLSFRVCPAYAAQAPELLDASAQRAAELSIRCLQVFSAEGDEDQKALLTAAGFTDEARLRERLREGQRWRDLLVFSRVLPGAGHPVRDQADYYSGRRAWQEERIASRAVFGDRGSGRRSSSGQEPPADRDGERVADE
jgi:L-amino acid N-acyltransferase YncA